MYTRHFPLLHGILFFSLTFMSYAVIKSAIYDIYSPFFFTSVLYLVYFSLMPAFNIYIEGFLSVQRNLLLYFITGILIFIIGFLFFSLGYFSFGNMLKERAGRLKFPVLRPGKTLFIVSIVLEFIGILSFYLWTRKTGISFFIINPFNLTNYYIKLSHMPVKSTAYLSLPLLFVITSNLIMLEYRINGYIKKFFWINFILLSLVIFSKGTRYIGLIFWGSTILFYIIRHRGKVNKLLIASIAVILVFAFVVIAYLRGMQYLNLIRLNPDFFYKLFLSSLSIFTPYIKVIKSIPAQFHYFLGESLYYIFVLPIPRVLWPDKPYSRYMLTLWHITGGKDFGYAIPNIGEMYANAGIPGVMLGMGITGFALRFIYETFKLNRDNIIVLIFYTIFYFFLFQIISRGFFAQIFVEFLYLFFPVLLLFLIAVLQKKSNNAIR